MNKWIAEFDLEDGDTMPEHMDLEYKGAKLDFHCRPLWIPVSEGLPKKSGNYWCTFGGTNLTGKDYYITESDAKETFDEPEKYAGWRSQNVIAWMPLPEPYKAEIEQLKALPSVSPQSYSSSENSNNAEEYDIYGDTE